MHCSCRAAPLRTFIHGLAQVHKIDSSSTPRTWISAASSRSYTQRLVTPTRQSNKSFLQIRYYSDNVVTSGNTAAKAENKLETTEALQALIEDSSNDAKTVESKAEGASENARPSSDNTTRGGNGRNPTSTSASKKSKRPRWRDVAPESQPARNKPKHFASKETNHPQKQASEQPKTGDENPAISKKHPQETWRVQKERLKEKFPEGWKPRKRLSPDALAGIRALNAQFPEIYTTQNLANKFEVSAEHIRRILKSKWQPDAEQEQGRQERWHRRGMQIWETKAALGVKPPRKWRAEGITRDPAYHARRKARIQRDKEWEEEETNKYKAYRASLKKAAGKVV